MYREAEAQRARRKALLASTRAKDEAALREACTFQPNAGSRKPPSPTASPSRLRAPSLVNRLHRTLEDTQQREADREARRSEILGRTCTFAPNARGEAEARERIRRRRQKDASGSEPAASTDMTVHERLHATPTVYTAAREEAAIEIIQRVAEREEKINAIRFGRTAANPADRAGEPPPAEGETVWTDDWDAADDWDVAGFEDFEPEAEGPCDAQPDEGADASF
jgi:hypothetical protein